METNYQSNVKEQYQLEASTPLASKNELSPTEKESILKDIYSSISFFEKLIYEAREELNSSKE